MTKFLEPMDIHGTNACCFALADSQKECPLTYNCTGTCLHHDNILLVNVTSIDVICTGASLEPFISYGMARPFSSSEILQRVLLLVYTKSS